MLGVTVDIILALRPRTYLIGNVPGLDDATQWHIVQRQLARLAMVGYCVADYASLDAADYGVPQHRLRPFWFGHLGGPCIRWPAPTHCDPRELATLQLPGVAALKPWVTCRDALQHLPIAQLGRPVRIKPHVDHNLSSSISPSKTITRNTHGDGCLLTNRRHPPAAPAATLGAKDRGQSTVLQAALDWPWDRPSTTVFAEDRLMPPGHHSGSNLSQPNAIVLSEIAATILQGFPESWYFHGSTKRARWSQLGQAMPPPLAEAIARAVRGALEGIGQ